MNTSMGSMPVGSSWLDRPWIVQTPGVSVMAGISQNNLVVRTKDLRPRIRSENMSTFTYFRS